MHPSTTSCQPFTALFNLNRDQIDGRSIDMYVAWLSKTCEIFPHLVVFHDGCLDGLNFTSATLIKIKLEELRTFELQDKVRKVLSDFKSGAPQDITFLLPDYSLVQLSKFELAQKVLSFVETDSVLWIDAGISRFLSASSVSHELQTSSGYLLDNEYDYCFEIDTRKNFDFAKMRLRKPEVGSCKRVVSGTSFWISKAGINPLYEATLNCASSWLEDGVWDNEQLILRYVLPAIKGRKLFIVQGKNRTGRVCRSMIEGNWRPRELWNTLINALMR